MSPLVEAVGRGDAGSGGGRLSGHGTPHVLDGWRAAAAAAAAAATAAAEPVVDGGRPGRGVEPLQRVRLPVRPQAA